MATIAEQVQQVYIGLLGRAAEKAGLDYWVDEITTGKITLDQVRANFVSSQDEYITGIGQMSRPDAITALYENLFERAPEAEGLAYWNTGGGKDIAIDGLLFALIDGAALSDSTALDNKTEVADYYTAATAAGQAYDAAKAAAVIANVGADSQSVVDGKALVDGVNGSAEMLTVNQDNITGTAQSDTFNAYIFDNQNTAQSGDMIDGGTGTDRLYADIGNSQKFAVTLSTESVEQFAVRAEASNTTDQTDNNLQNDVTIDAERMEGTNWYESNNSRADVIIEDVRIERVAAYNDATDQITRDITVAMVSTDPGNVDLGVYFDQHSLVKSGAAVSNSITLNVGNQLETNLGFDSAKPLDDIPYDQVSFVVNGTTVTLNIDLTGVETYAQMYTQLQAAFATEKQTNAALLDVNLTRTLLTEDFISKDGENRQADEYILTTENGTIAPAAVGWNASAGLPSNNAFSASVVKGDTTTTSSLITSTVVLDDVGRGSMGGDLLIGGLSTGATSDSKGVEQFDITVERSSQLQEIMSTNNTLREVYIKNGAVKGDLVVAGNTNGDDDLPGSGADGSAGFSDVRVVDASAMEGKVSIDAELTDAVVGKYLDLKDSASDASADNVDFLYKLGTNDDKLDLSITKSNLASAGTGTREDFVLNIEGNGGDDSITTIIGDGSGTDGDFWYNNQDDNANLTIDAGAGNDTVTTTGAGDFVIDAGAGNDTVYTNNDGNGKAVSTSTASITITQGTEGSSEKVTVVTFSNLAVGDTLVIGNLSLENTTLAAILPADLITYFNGGAIPAGATAGGALVGHSTGSPTATELTYTSTASTTTVPADLVITGPSGATAGAPTVNGVATEIQTVTFAAGNVGETIFFDGVLTTLVDTNGSGTVEATEVAAQVTANTNSTTGTWNATNQTNGSVQFTGVSAGIQDALTVTGIIGGGTYSETTTTTSTSTAATWVTNVGNSAVNANINDLNGGGAGTATLAEGIKLTVTFSGATGSAVGGLTSGTAVAGAAGGAPHIGNGFESTVVISTANKLGNNNTYNQAIKKAINEDAVLSKLLVATDGPEDTLVIKSLVDGQFGTDDLLITATAPSSTEIGDLSSSARSALVDAQQALDNDSTASYSDNQLATFLNTTASNLAATISANTNGSNTTNITGSASISVSDNKVTLGTGDDVAVLGTDNTSNDTLVFEGSFGNDTIFNFVETGGGADVLDFTAYLGGQVNTTGSSSDASKVTIDTAASIAGVGSNHQAQENEVIVINDFTSAAGNTASTENWENLTANDLLAAIKGTSANTDAYSTINHNTLDVDTSHNSFTVNGTNYTSFVGNVQKNVVLIENDKNAGEYKVFELSSDITTDEFTAAELVGTIDVGNNISATSIFA